MIYRFLKLVVSLGIRFYYREIKVLNAMELEQGKDEPLIIIANHPNTLMDAMLVGYSCKQPIHFMAKGTLFNSPFKLWILRKFNMIPINRQSDAKVEGISNQDSFEACYKLLSEGNTLVVFPEGTSFLERHLRELKTGTARIALEAAKRNGKEVKIVPVGLNYLRAEKFRSSVLIHVGQKIDVMHLVADYAQDSGKTAKRLTEKFRVGLERVLVNSELKEHETLTDQIAELLSSKYARDTENIGEGVEADVNFLKQIRNRIEEFELTKPWLIDELKVEVEQIKTALKSAKLRPDLLDRRFRMRMFFRQLLFSMILLIVGLPVFLFGVVVNIIPFKVTDLVIPKLTKDIEYVAPFSLLLGLILYPIEYAIIYNFSVDYVTHVWWGKLLFFALLPVSGLVAYSYFRYFLHIKSKWNYVFQWLSNRNLVLNLQEKKEHLKKLLFND